jgi:hypothetical protein
MRPGMTACVLCFARMAGPLRSISCSHSGNILLRHPQMHPEEQEIGGERAGDLDRAHSRFNVGESCLVLEQSGCIGSLIELAFEVP